MKKILLIHNKYRYMGGEDIAVENELSFLKDKFEVETLFFENNITNLLSEIKSFVLNKNSKSVKKLKKKFNPYCSVATWYLWRSIDDEPIQY